MAPGGSKGSVAPAGAAAGKNPWSSASQPQLFSSGVPHGTQILMLVYTFDTSAVPDWRALRTRDHQRAADRQLEVMRLKPGAGAVAARAVVGDAADTAATHSLPFDAWHADPGPAVKIEFLHAKDAPALGIRVLTDLMRCDGVTAARAPIHPARHARARVSRPRDRNLRRAAPSATPPPT